MTTQDLTDLALTPTQQAHVDTLLARAYAAGRAVGRAETTRERRLTPVPAVIDGWELGELSDAERDALVAGLGTA